MTWYTMKNLATLHDLPWLCIGDFNEVLRSDENDGIGQRNQAQVQGFHDAIDACGLVDLGFQGRPWTFETKVAGGSFTRVHLDRALGSAEWCAQFPLATVEHLAAATSDHLPIFLKLDTTDDHRKIEKEFWYEVMWVSGGMTPG